MGRFTDYISNAAQRFRDPGQILDAFLPGDIRQDGRWVPSGIAAGVGQILTGAPASLTEPLISRMLGGGRQSPVTNAGLGPTGALPTTGGNGFLQGGFGGTAARDPNFRMPGTQDWIRGATGPERAATDAANAQIVEQTRGTVTNPRSFNGPSFGGNNMTAHSGPGGTISSQRGLGLGQLGRGGDESLAAFAASLFTRGGTQAEQ